MASIWKKAFSQGNLYCMEQKWNREVKVPLSWVEFLTQQTHAFNGKIVYQQQFEKKPSYFPYSYNVQNNASVGTADTIVDPSCENTEETLTKDCNAKSLI